MRLTIIVVSLLFAGSLAAQSKTAVLQPSVTYDASCPVGLSARQKADGQTLWTIALEDQRFPAKAAAAQRDGMGVAVELRAVQYHSVLGATFEVSYLPPGTRAMLIDRAGLVNGMKMAKKTFSLTAGDGGTLKLAGDLLVGRAATIDRVHLVSLTYADGSQWLTKNPASCVVAPSRMVLVDAR